MFDNNNNKNNRNYSGHKMQKLLLFFFLCVYRVLKCDFVCFNFVCKSKENV